MSCSPLRSSTIFWDKARSLAENEWIGSSVPRFGRGSTKVCIMLFLFAKTQIPRYIQKQGRIHGIRCYETPFSAVKEKALRTYGPTDGRTDRPSYRGASEHLKTELICKFILPSLQLKNMPLRYLFNPWSAPEHIQQQAGCIIGKDYPHPIGKECLF